MAARKSTTVSRVGRTMRTKKDFHGIDELLADIIIYSNELLFSIFYQDFFVIPPNGHLANFKVVK
jgi:hypothetical protein